MFGLVKVWVKGVQISEGPMYLHVKMLIFLCRNETKAATSKPKSLPAQPS